MQQFPMGLYALTQYFANDNILYRIIDVHVITKFGSVLSPMYHVINTF